MLENRAIVTAVLRSRGDRSVGVNVVEERGQAIVGLSRIDRRNTHLVQVILALGLVGRLADLLHRRQKHAHQHGDDGDDHEQFNQREPSTPIPNPGSRHCGAFQL